MKSIVIQDSSLVARLFAIEAIAQTGEIYDQQTYTVIVRAHSKAETNTFISQARQNRLNCVIGRARPLTAEITYRLHIRCSANFSNRRQRTGVAARTCAQGDSRPPPSSVRAGATDKNRQIIATPDQMANGNWPSPSPPLPRVESPFLTSLPQPNSANRLR